MPSALLEHQDRLFRLKGWDTQLQYVVITPQPVKGEVIRNAWSYAVKYSAVALDVPDHAAAIKLMLQRHPTWLVIESICPTIEVELFHADKDVPEQ